MPKPSINRKAEMLSEAARSERKAKGYAAEARAYKNAEKGGASGSLGDRYTREKEANNAMANQYESEAEVMRQRASNSKEQYDHERKAGDPNALKLSFKEWQKL
jgi:hypothetical protein